MGVIRSSSRGDTGNTTFYMGLKYTNEPNLHGSHRSTGTFSPEYTVARTGTVGLMPNVNVTSCNHFTLKPAQGHEWIDKSLIMLTARTLAVTRYHLAPGMSQPQDAVQDLVLSARDRYICIGTPRHINVCPSFWLHATLHVGL